MLASVLIQVLSSAGASLVRIFKNSGLYCAGRMATALARGCLHNGLLGKKQLLAADPFPAARESFVSQVAGTEVFDNNEPILARADIVFLAIKPQVMAGLLAEIGKKIASHQLVVSIAAGVTLKTLSQALPANACIIRVMPNTPCLVGEGVSCFSRGSAATEEQAESVRHILASVGAAFEVPEDQLDAVTGLSGSGPAFFYRVIECMAEGGTAMGLPADLALQLAAQTARGAAKMVLTTGHSPAELVKQVTSPGGTTLAGLETLAKLQGSEAFREAVVAASRRSHELGSS